MAREVPSGDGEMSFARRAIVQIVVLGLLTATGTSIATNVEYWPICNYPMFSVVPHRGSAVGRPPPPPTPELAVVHGDGREHPYPAEEGVLYREFDGYTAQVVINRLLHTGKDDREKLSRFLVLLLDGLRKNASHAASPADRPRALRLYLVRRAPPGPGQTRGERTRQFLLEVAKAGGA